MEEAHRGRTCLFLFAIACAFLFPLFAFASTSVSVEEKVRAFFEDTPVMIEIARCESKFRQFTEDGQPLRGGWGGGMIGVFQIFDAVHKTDAQSLGFDIATLEGNLGYAKHLYAVSGTSPWNSAKDCWMKAATEKTEAPDDAQIAELKKKIVTLTLLVTQLQQLLAQKV